MKKRNRPYLHYSDRPLFKLLGFLVTAIYFLLGYFSLFCRVELGIGSLLGLLYPCVMVGLWESVKRRHFWIGWLLFGLVCLVVLYRFDDTTLLGGIAVNAYWISAFLCCVVQIVSCSRAERRSKLREEEARISEVPIPDPVKDAFLEELFKE